MVTDLIRKRMKRNMFMSAMALTAMFAAAAALGISTRAVRKHLKFTVEQFRRHFGKHGK